MTTDPANPPSARQTRWRVFPALAIIAIGVLFLLGNLGYDLAFLRFTHWWAWLILAVALIPLGRAWEHYRATGKFDGEVLHELLAALAVATVAAIFLLDLDWGVWWPLFVIIGGLFALVERPQRRRGERSAHDSRDPSGLNR